MFIQWGGTSITKEYTSNTRKPVDDFVDFSFFLFKKSYYFDFDLCVCAAGATNGARSWSVVHWKSSKDPSPCPLLSVVKLFLFSTFSCFYCFALNHV